MNSNHRTARRRAARLALALVTGAGSLVAVALSAGPAHAIIGRPLTPFSVAGVARRTTRRAVYRGAAYGAYGAGGAYGYGAYGAEPGYAAPPPVVVAPRPVVVAPSPVYW
jgi:hypothetical protein